MPTLSIIIPSYGSSHLSAVIDALRPLEPLQIIVVDSSSEKPAPIAAVTLINLSQHTAPGKARNEGARRARGDYLLFVDADVVFSSVTRTAVRAWIERETKATVCGLYDTRAEDSFATRLHNAVLAFRLFGRAGAATPLKSSSHFLMPRTEFIRVGGFNEEIESYEDVEFFTRCERLGVSMLTDPSLCAAHLKQYTAASVLADYFRKAHNAFLVRKRYPNLWHGSGLHLGWPIAITWMIAALLPL